MTGGWVLAMIKIYNYHQLILHSWRMKTNQPVLTKICHRNINIATWCSGLVLKERIFIYKFHCVLGFLCMGFDSVVNDWKLCRWGYKKAKSGPVQCRAVIGWQRVWRNKVVASFCLPFGTTIFLLLYLYENKKKL